MQIKVERCAWCSDYHNPSPKHHPNGQVEHVPEVPRAVRKCVIDDVDRAFYCEGVGDA